jgi:Membrane-associated phospholipid phosphatase
MANRIHMAVALAGAVAVGILVGLRPQFDSFGAAPSGAREFSHGYLSAQAAAGINLPPPPAAGSHEIQRDEESRKVSLQARTGPRYALAMADSDRSQAGSVRSFRCAFGMNIDTKETPKLFALLSRLRYDVRSTAYRLKSRYQRERPFVAEHGRACSQSEDQLRASGSYPSAGSAVGWAYALVLSAVNPQRRDALRRRGFDYGQSRLVCDAEWQSDVDAGRNVASEAVRQMQANAQFRQDLAAARDEVAQLLASGHQSPMDCTLENQLAAR